MKLYRYSNSPIVGQWIPLTERQNELALAQLTETQTAQLENMGSAEISFRENSNTRWPSMLVVSENYKPRRDKATGQSL